MTALPYEIALNQHFYFLVYNSDQKLIKKYPATSTELRSTSVQNNAHNSCLMTLIHYRKHPWIPKTSIVLRDLMIYCLTKSLRFYLKKIIRNEGHWYNSYTHGSWYVNWSASKLGREHSRCDPDIEIRFENRCSSQHTIVHMQKLLLLLLNESHYRGVKSEDC